MPAGHDEKLSVSQAVSAQQEGKNTFVVTAGLEMATKTNSTIQWSKSV